MSQKCLPQQKAVMLLVYKKTPQGIPLIFSSNVFSTSSTTVRQHLLSGIKIYIIIWRKKKKRVSAVMPTALDCSVTNYLLCI